MESNRMVLNATEVAQALNVSRPTVYALMRRSDFPVLKIGTRKVVPRLQLEEWIAQQTEGK